MPRFLDRSSTDDRLGPAVVLAVGGGFLAAHILHVFGEGEAIREFLFGILIPMLLSAAVVAGGLWLWRGEYGGGRRLLVGVWCLVGTAALSAGAVLIILYQYAEGAAVSHWQFVIINASSLGSLVGFVVGVYEVRQRVARAEADRLSRRLTVLNRVLRHDIRTNANVIQGNAQLLAEEAAGTAERADRIYRRAEDLVDLGRHARDIERLLEDHDEDLRTTDIAAVVETHADRLREEYTDAEVTVSVPDSAVVAAHPLTGTAIANVLENALEHNDGPSPLVDAAVRRDSAGAVSLQVRDNGPGIPEAERAVLERGYETDLEHTSGIGLWLTNWTVRASGGRIEFRDGPDGGSVVDIRFEGSPTVPTRTEQPAD